MSSDTPHSSNESVKELLEKFSGCSDRQRKSLVKPIEGIAKEISDIGSAVLDPFDSNGDDWAAGWILQVVKRHCPDSLEKFIPDDSEGWFSTCSTIGIDFHKLQGYLLAERFEEADRFTSSVLRQLAGSSAESRGYVYFSEVSEMPGEDLVTIDRLWNAYSQGKFGFSVQARLLKNLGGAYERLWPRVGWKNNGVWTRYPKAFTWSLSAPEGHMPLINQLRGVRLMDALLNHPSIKERY